MVLSRLQRQARRETEDDFSARLVTLADPSNVTSEAYRTLRTNLIYSRVAAPLKTIVLTSYGSAKGTSTACANLGVVLSQAEKNTLLIDCDFRQPVMHKIFRLRNIRGVVDVLSGDHSMQEVEQAPLTNLRVIPVGPVPPNPTELLSSKQFAEIMTSLRHSFDYVLLDAPPLENYADAAILAAQADATMLVLDAQQIRETELRRAIRSLESVGATILGTILNNADRKEAGYHYPSLTQ